MNEVAPFIVQIFDSLNLEKLEEREKKYSVSSELKKQRKQALGMTKPEP